MCMCRCRRPGTRLYSCGGWRLGAPTRVTGLPADVIARAREILRRHEQSEEKLTQELSPGAAAGHAEQTHFAAIDSSVVGALRSADLNQLTPLEAMNLLAALQKQLT